MKDDEEQRRLRLSMEVLITKLLMKIHGGEITADKARTELKAILTQRKGATEADIRGARIDIPQETRKSPAKSERRGFHLAEKRRERSILPRFLFR